MSDGVLYVEIMPSTKGIGKAVERDANAAFAGAEKTGTSFFQKVGTWAKRGALAVTGMVAAVGALAITGGISRALNIEDAQAKLKGLGHDAKSVEAIMTDALAAVRGTAFGLDTAATVAATAVAAGIKPGQELEKYLRLTADAATIAGVSMEEMGTILNKATTAGKVYTQELNQLADRGLPIFQWLQEEYGVTAEELRKMVERGEVDAATFRKVIEDNIGGAALASGDTTRGAFANMRAAISRFGVALLGDGLGAAKTFFSEVTVIFDGLTERVAPFVEKVQEKLGGMFQIEGMGDRFLGWLDRMVSAVESGPIPQLLSALAPILPVILDAAKLIGSALGDAFRELGDALAPVLPMLAETLAKAVVELAPSLVELLVALLPLIPPLAQLLGVIAPLAADLIELLIPAIQWLVDLLANELEIVKQFFDLLSGEQDMNGLIEFLMNLEGPLGDLYRWLADGVTQFAYWASGIRSALTDALIWVGGILDGIRDWFASTWETIGLVLGGALQFIWGLLTGNMQLMQTGVAQALDAIRNWWTSTWSGIASFVSGIWSSVVSTVSSGIGNVVTFVSSLPGKVLSAVSSFKTLLVQAGKDLIQGLINGVSSMITNAVNSVKNVGGQMLDGVKSFLGIQSPSRRFRDEVGKMVGLGLLAGVEDQAIRGRIDTAVNHLVEVPSVVAPAGGGFPDQVTLVDRDGSILALLDVLLNSAFAGGSSAALSSRLGTRVAR